MTKLPLLPKINTLAGNTRRAHGETEGQGQPVMQRRVCGDGRVERKGSGNPLRNLFLCLCALCASVVRAGPHFIHLGDTFELWVGVDRLAPGLGEYLLERLGQKARDSPSLAILAHPALAQLAQ